MTNDPPEPKLCEDHGLPFCAECATIPMEACPNPWCEADDGEYPPVPYRVAFGNWRVSCTSCSMSGPTRSTEAEAIAAWNERPTTVPEGLVEAKARLSHEAYNRNERNEGLTGGDWSAHAIHDMGFDAGWEAALATLSTTPPASGMGDELEAFPLVFFDGEKHRDGMWVPQETFAALRSTPAPDALREENERLRLEVDRFRQPRNRPLFTSDPLNRLPGFEPQHLLGLALVFRSWCDADLWGRPEEAEHAARQLETAYLDLIALRNMEKP